MMKKIRNVLMILIFILVMIMAGQEAYALEDTNVQNGTTETENYTFSDLSDKWYLLCSQKNGHLNSELVSYIADDPTICKPKEAFILLHALHGNDGSHYNNVQYAWWKTDAGSLGDAETTVSEIDTQASSYQTFVKKIAETPSDVSDTSKYVDMSHEFSNGTATIKFPKIKNNLISASTDKVNVSFDTEKQKYIIGPLTLNYAQSTDFGFITNFAIYTDASSEPVSSEKWSFIREKEVKTDENYPDNNEEFYIELDYIDGATKITHISADYKYFICGGSHQYLRGKYIKSSFDPATGAIETKSNNAQILSYINYAVGWYETKPIEVLADNANEGSIEITKKALDENGKELTSQQVKELFGEDQNFKFEVIITHSDGTQEKDTVNVKAGSSTIAGPYSWTDDEEAPTYEVKEVTENENWQNTSMENEKGQLKSKSVVSAVNVNATNKIVNSKEGNIKIIKKINKVSDKDQVFNFNVSITDKGSTSVSEIVKLSVTVKAGQLQGESAVITRKWNGDNAPTYEVREEANSEYALISIESGKGVFQDKNKVSGGIVNVYVTNNKIGFYEKKIRLIKVIEAPITKDQTFYFNVKVTQNGVTETIPATIKISGDGKTISNTWESEKAWSWYEGEEAPKVQIEELTDKGDAGLYTVRTMTPAEPTSMDDGTDLSFYQTYAVNSDKSAPIQIIKTTSEPTTKDETFTFKLTVVKNGGAGETVIDNKEIPITVKAGTTSATWPEKEEDRIIVSWDAEKEEAPIAIVTENANEYYEATEPQVKTLGTEGEAAAVFNVLNKAKAHQGYITLTKELEEGQISGETFNFEVKVSGVTDTKEGTMQENVVLKAGETKKLTYHWIGDKAPTFEIEETNVDTSKYAVNSITATNVATGEKIGNKSGNKITGQLVTDGDAEVSVKFINDMNKHKGNLKIVKDIYTTEKISKETLASDGTKFEIQVVINGTFSYAGKNYDNSSVTIKKSLPDNGAWSFDISNVEWYGDKAPTFTVTENLSSQNSSALGWRMRTLNIDNIETNSTKEGYSFIDDKTITATVTNELPSVKEIDLTFSMSGIVWIDEPVNEKNTEDYYNKVNGVYDEVGHNGEPEKLKENVEVNVYKVIYDKSGNEQTRTLAESFKDTSNNKVEYPLITGTDGKWTVQRIGVPAFTNEDKSKGYTVEGGYSVSYDVEFIYDGQNYEPTEFLSYQLTSDGKAIKNNGSDAEKANTYINATTKIKDRYAKDSMALEVYNNSKNIVSVSGKTEIDSEGNTTGTVTLANGMQEDVTYSSNDAGTAYPTHSTLNTTNANGMTLDLFKATARTSAGGLTFPFDVEDYNGSSLTDSNTYIDEDGVHHKYKFMAVYNYCLNINLGLKEKEEVDVALSKKLTTAKVVVKEKLYQYNYSPYYDLTVEKQSSLGKDIVVAGDDINVEYTLGLYRSDYYYRAEMYSTGADTSVYTALKDFYKTLGSTSSIKDTEMDIYLTYNIKLTNGSTAYSVNVNSIDDYYDSSYTLVKADEQKYLKTKTETGKEEQVVNSMETVAKASDYADKWNVTKTGILGSDKDANGNNVVYNKMTANGLNIKLEPEGTAEFTLTFKVNKNVDSTYGISDSIILGQKCNVAEIASYSTFDLEGNNAGKLDRDSAPSNINITKYNTKSWYEDDTFAAPKLKVNLIAESNERTVSGLVWEDNSNDKNVENPGADEGYNQTVGNGIKDADESTIAGLSTTLVEKIIVQNPSDGTYTQYEYIWPTDTPLNCLSGQKIEDITGLDSTIKTNDEGIYTFNAVATGDYSIRFTYGEDSANKISSADYSTSKYYNGQDYKSTALTANANNSNAITSDGYIRSDAYLDIKADNTNKNAAIDNEIRRLQVVQNSTTITYENGSVMGEYQDDLFKDYYMYADTLKLDVNIELDSYGKEDYKYKIENVNGSIEERPMTAVTLDKQIEEIVLKTSDGKTIMDAKYNIEYEINGGDIKAKVTLDETNSYGTDNLMSLNRDIATNQGFRYINVDETILHGTTVTIKYRFTAINAGEVDRTGELAVGEWTEERFNTACDDLAKKFASYEKDGSNLVNSNISGKYVGSIYYLGINGNKNDAVVTTTVRQVIDYVDNDAVFNGMENAIQNMSWSTTTVDELNNKKYVDPDLIETVNVGTSDEKNVIKDSNGIAFTNLIVNVDNKDTSVAMNNSGFIVDLQPQAAYAKNALPYMSSMNLVISKYISSDSENLDIDNIGEIIKYDNIVGRRDELAITGNQNPAEALTKNPSEMTKETVGIGMVKQERDTSSSEAVTITEPTGSSVLVWKLQVALVTTIGLIILCAGIVFIKKKVLK